MNTYIKYAPNVFLAKCSNQYKKGDTIPVTTKYGKDNECIVHNLILEKDGFFYCSITRADGYNAQKRAEAKAEKYNSWASGAEKKSEHYYERSNKDRDFLSLGEPVKVGHHSEKRHRKVIQEAQDNMGKSVEFIEKAASHESKAEYWESRKNDINLSMPESLDFYTFKLAEAKAYHEGVKLGKIERSHSFTLTYAKKEVNELEKKLQIATKLWA
ncbi:MAG: DUF3560 domain-containing protein [Cytophagaceae bacterium]|nr:DUF3560 domain-containing protein [Cytophagaceae bacterium]